MTLADFLLARIAEDEEYALGAVISGQTWVDFDLRDGSDHSEILDTASMVIGTLPQRAAEHVARWDPTRVLAECEAKRRVIDLVTSVPEALFHRAEDTHRAPGRRAFTDEQQDAVLRALASPYSAHPDYRDEWRP